MNYRRPAIILTIIAVIFAAMVGLLQYRAAIERNKQQQKLLEARKSIEFAQRRVEQRRYLTL